MKLNEYKFQTIELKKLFPNQSTQYLLNYSKKQDPILKHYLSLQCYIYTNNEASFLKILNENRTCMLCYLVPYFFNQNVYELISNLCFFFFKMCTLNINLL